MRNRCEEDTLKQLQQWFALNDMSEEGSITKEAAQRIAEQEDGRASPEELNEVLVQVPAIVLKA